jgi:heme-degrading monooxygenase HmoA
MAIKVLLKRTVDESNAEALKALIDRLRSATAGQPGYISGETLRCVDRPGEHLVISNWKSRYYWDQWYQSAKRTEIQQQIDTLLGTPTEFDIYEYE